MAGKESVIVEVIAKDSRGRILLLRRGKKNRHFVGKWQLPGGKVERGETITDAAKREFFEETSCRCSKLKSEKFFRCFGKFNGRKGFFLLFVFSCRMRGKVVPTGDHSEFKFFKRQEMRRRMLAPASRKALFF